jgi:hypothetical protein
MDQGHVYVLDTSIQLWMHSCIDPPKADLAFVSQGNVAALHTALDIIGQVEDTGSSVRPNVISYNAVIDAVAGGLAYGDERHRCFDEALKVYRRMQAQYVQPTVITYTALISAAKLQVRIVRRPLFAYRQTSLFQCTAKQNAWRLFSFCCAFGDVFCVESEHHCFAGHRRRRV